MQEGIGRGGYRVLALVFFGVAALGLVVAAAALDPQGFFEWLGLALAGAFLAALAALAMVAFGSPGARRSDPMPEPAGAPVIDLSEGPPVEPAPAADPAADIGMDYQSFEPVSVEERLARGPPPRPQPPPVPITQPRRVDRAKSGSGWPDRAEPSGVTRRQLHERNLPRDPGPTIEMDAPAAPAPAPRTREPPVVMARTVASAEASGIPDGSSIGKCGNCGVLLLAPKKRPIRLQCPRCERVHTLA